MSNSITLVSHPRFASQIRNMPSPLGNVANLQRGYMIQDKNLFGNKGGPLGDGRDLINFLFNPATVSSSYAVGNASLQAAMMYTVPNDNGSLLSPMLQQTVGFQLLYDRTYELNYGGNGGAVNDPAVIGCQADVYQFMQFTGMLNSLTAQQQSSLASQSGTTSNATPPAGGIMMMIPCWLVFGNAFEQMNNNQNNTNFRAINQQMLYYGYISGWSVTYTHFTQYMVPIRCAIDVNFTMLPNPSVKKGTAPWRDPAQQGNANITVPHPAGWTPTPPPIFQLP